ncbi:hypothetical protein ACLOJK_035056 [Asimina triloba]
MSKGGNLSLYVAREPPSTSLATVLAQKDRSFTWSAATKERLDRLEAENEGMRGANAGVRLAPETEGQGPATVGPTPSSVVTPTPYHAVAPPSQPVVASPRPLEQGEGSHQNPAAGSSAKEEFLNEWIRRQPFQMSIVPLTQHRPYPIEIEAEEFPKGFTMPNFERK